MQFPQQWGGDTIAASDYQLAIGKYNISSNNETQLFIVGNGTAGDSRSNAFVVGSDGKLYSNGNYPISDVRLKENIEEIDNPLSKVLKLRGVYYD